MSEENAVGQVFFEGVDKARSDGRAEVIGEIENWAEGKKLEYPYHDERFSREVLSELLSFLSSLRNKHD